MSTPRAPTPALEYLLDGAATIDRGQCLFLTSEQIYQDRLEPQEDLHRQRVTGPAPFDETGLPIVPVEHTGIETTRRRRSRS